MNVEQLRQRLLEAARRAPETAQVPFGFEDRFRRRLLTRIRHSPMARAPEPWTSLLCRALTPCLGIMILAALFTLAAPAPSDSVDAGLKAILLADLELVDTP